MRNRSFVWICLFLLGAVCAAAQGGAGATASRRLERDEKVS
jgi:hypothetical protein